MIDFNSYITRIKLSTSRRTAECKIRYILSIRKEDFYRVEDLLSVFSSKFNFGELWINRERVRLDSLEGSTEQLYDAESAEFYFNLYLEGGGEEECEKCEFTNAFSISCFRDGPQFDISLNIFVDLFSEELFITKNVLQDNKLAAENNRIIFNQIFNQVLTTLIPFRIEFEDYCEMDYAWVLGMRSLDDFN